MIQIIIFHKKFNLDNHFDTIFHVDHNVYKE